MRRPTLGSVAYAPFAGPRTVSETMFLLYSLCLSLCVVEILWWCQIHVPSGARDKANARTVVSVFESEGGTSRDSTLTQYLLDGVDLQVGGVAGEERVFLTGTLTGDEKSFLFLTEDDVILLEDLLPNVTTSPRHNTCAFVGNSASLLSEERGGEIDRHQAVLRFIDSTSTKYDAHVGRKRTYLSVTTGSIDAFIPESEYDKAKRPRSKALVVHGDIPVHDYAELRKSQPDVQAYYLSPSFDMNARKAYGRIADRMRRLGGRWASIANDPMPQALLPLFFMRAICKIVFVYGFTAPVSAGSEDLFAPTYYGQPKSFSERPQSLRMEEILRMLMLEGEVELVS